MSQGIAKASHLSLDDALVEQADELNIDVSQAAAEGVLHAIKAERERLWRLENAEAIRQSNDYVERHGLPLARHRPF